MHGDEDIDSEEDLNARVEAIARESGAIRKTDVPSERAVDELSSGKINAKDRLSDLSDSDPADPVLHEQKLKIVNRLLLRGIALDTIAEQMGVTPRTVRNYRSEIHRRLRKEAATLDLTSFIGESLAFYNEVISLNMRIASMNDKPIQARIAAMRTAVAAKNDMATFMDKTGVLDQVQYEREDNRGKDEIEKLVSMTMDIIKNTDNIDDLPSEEELSNMDDDDEMLLMRM